MHKRLQNLNLIAISVVVVYTVIIMKVLAQVTIVGPLVDSIGAFLTSVFVYKLVINVLYGFVEKNKLALKLYWGREFLDGLWYYTYFHEGTNGDASKVFFGVWRFEQNLFGAKVSGFGLTDGFVVRSRVRSLTDLMENQGEHEIFNLRTDNAIPDQNFYSRSSFSFDTNPNSWVNYPVKMRGKTIIYGGKLTGDVHVDTYIKCETARSEDEAITLLKRFLKSNYSQYRNIVINSK